MNRYRASLKQKKEAIILKMNADRDGEMRSYAGNLYRDKNFLEQFFVLYRASTFLNVLCMMLSLMTMSSLLFYLIADVFFFINIYITLLFAIIVAVVVEVFKKNSSSNFFLELYKNGIPPLYVVVPFVLASGISLSGAYFGAITLPKVYEKVFFIEIEDSEQDERIALIKESLNEAKEDVELYKTRLAEKWDRYIQTTLIPAAISKRNALQKELDKALQDFDEKAEKERNALQKEIRERAQEISLYILYAGIIAEVLFFLSSMFIFFYLFNVYLEDGSEDDVKKETVGLFKRKPTNTAGIQEDVKKN